MTRFWNELHHVAQSQKIGKPNNLKFDVDKDRNVIAERYER